MWPVTAYHLRVVGLTVLMPDYSFFRFNPGPATAVRRQPQQPRYTFVCSDSSLTARFRSCRSWIRNADLKLEQTSRTNCMGIYYHMRDGI